MAHRNAWFPTPANLEPLAELAIDELSGDGPATPSRVILDVRPRAAYAAAHVEGSLHVDGRGALSTWYGWVASIEAEVTLVATSHADAASAQRELRRIGVDDIRGVCIAPDLTAVAGASSLPRVSTLRCATFGDLAQELRLGEDIVVLDVREADEREALRIANAVGIPMHELPAADIESLRGRNVWIHCAAGFRATIAASLLERRGVPCTIVDVHIDVAADLGLAYEPRAGGSARRAEPQPAIAPLAA